jgi:hypothetical protein
VQAANVDVQVKGIILKKNAHPIADLARIVAGVPVQLADIQSTPGHQL